MAAQTVERLTGTTVEAQHRPPGFGATLRSEWFRFWALPANRTALLVTLGLTVGVSLLMVVFGDSAAMAREQAEGEYSVAFFGSHFGVMAFSALAATVVASEYRGSIGYTLTATPRRWRTLTAKLLIITGLGAVVGVAVSLVSFTVTQAAMGWAGVPAISLGDPGMLRAALLFAPLGMVVQALMTACAAVVLRHGPGAFVFVLLLGLLPILLAPYLGPWWGQNVPRYMTGAAVESVAGIAIPGTEGFLPTPAAIVVVVVWVGAFVGTALAVFSRRDA